MNTKAPPKKRVSNAGDRLFNVLVGIVLVGSTGSIAVSLYVQIVFGEVMSEMYPLILDLFKFVTYANLASFGVAAFLFWISRKTIQSRSE